MGKPIVRDCACRGQDAGFAHISCIIKYAQKKSEEATDSAEFVTPWEKCPNCIQCFQNDLAIHLSDAFVSYAKNIYGYSGNELQDKIKVMEALRTQIQANLSAATHVTLTREIKDAKDKIENLIHKLLALVDQAKEEHDLRGWELKPPTTYEFQEYSYICLTFEAFGYHDLAQLYSVDPSKEGRKTEIGYYSRARAIYDVFGDEVQSKLMTDNIHRVRAESGGDEGRNLKVCENIYHHALESAGQNATETILTGYNYAVSLLNVYHSIEAERLLTKLAATSRQVYGEEHNCTNITVELLKKCKTRLVRVPLAHLDADRDFQALRYENDGEICVVTGPIIGNEKGQMCRVASAMIHPTLGCPVVCHGLINAPHLNEKLGEVRSCKHEDGSGGDRFGVHFEEKGLKPVAVKPQNLRIAFELSSV